MPEPLSNHVPCLSQSSFKWPDHLVPSGWLEHIPFAFWLMDRLRPKLFVELGTYTGASYFAFCQIVKERDVGCRCYAIDTWAGDDHSGHYGEQVYETLRSYHDPRYGHFSKLCRSTFDAALDDFDAGSIELLHIDGLHTYEAVRHDFKTWRPKLAANAIVLFHDTAVQKDDFGVYRFWTELTAELPAFEFTHGNGLGVLSVGQVNEKLSDLFAASKSPESCETIRNAYAVLGSRLSQAVRIEQLLKKTEHLEKSVERYKVQVQNRTVQLQAYIDLAKRLRERPDGKQ